MIEISKIEFNNYRQYKNSIIKFSNSKNSNLHVLIARNGTGKTTFLNGIIWCLYGKEYYLNNAEKALPILNVAVVDESNENDKKYVIVRVTIEDDNDYIVFERKQVFQIVYDYLTYKKSTLEGDVTFTASITSKRNNQNTRTYDNEEANNLVKQYFDESIYNYYFFDGENLRSYFEKGRSNNIKESIYNISQVTLLGNTLNHIDKIYRSKNREAKKMPDLNIDLYSKENEYRSEISRLTNENADAEKRIDENEERKIEVDKILSAYAPIKNSISKRERLSSDKKQLEEEIKNIEVKRDDFIREYLVLLSFYSRISTTYNMIKEKENSGALPPNIDKKQIKDILENNLHSCPLCDNEIDKRSRVYLEELLNRLELSSETSHRLIGIKAYLEMFIDKCKNYQANKNELINKEKDLKNKLHNIEEELRKISSFLIKYADEEHFDKIDVPKLEKERRELNDSISNEKLKIRMNKQDIEKYESKLVEVEEQIENQKNLVIKHDEIKSQIAVIRELNSKFISIQDKIIKNIKDEIELRTWNFFDAMIWKKHTFSSISISKNYEVSVYNTQGNEITGSLGATEFMALAYSFTLAIHETSGKNCPLVVDSPLGRVSDLNRERMASELLKVSESKQIIMLFTPDEYSKEVEMIYNDNVGSIRSINLSEDEKEIERIG